MCEHFNETQAKTFKKYILSYQNYFAKPGEVGRTNIEYHQIKLHNENISRNLKEEFHPLHKRKALEEEIRNLEKQNLIEKSTSPWSFQFVMIQKKDRSWWVCVDYRKLNYETIEDAHRLTRIDDNMDFLNGAE